MKKIILIIIAIAGILQAVYFGSLIYTNFLPFGQTGAIYSPPDQSEAALGNAVSNLQKSLPLATSGFSIASFDYAAGKFIVHNYYPGSDLQSEFDLWYKNSSFSAIPKDMFLLQK